MKFGKAAIPGYTYNNCFLSTETLAYLLNVRSPTTIQCQTKNRMGSAGQHQTQKRAFNKRKQWTNQQMEAAMAEAITGRLSENKAADLHGVPWSMLKDRLSGRVTE